MRLLMDQEGMSWDQAWEICTKVFAYTNHTVLSEALEKWPMELIQRMLPRIWMILEEINRNMKFHQVIFTQASPASVCNAGLGSIGFAIYQK